MIKVDNAEDLKRVVNSSEKVLTLFYANWCPYCMAFVPLFNNKVGNLAVGKVVHVILDDYDNPLWDDYDVEAVPTIVFFVNGKISRRLDGKFGVGLNEKQLSVWLREFDCV